MHEDKAKAPTSADDADKGSTPSHETVGGTDLGAMTRAEIRPDLRSLSSGIAVPAPASSGMSKGQGRNHLQSIVGSKTSWRKLREAGKWSNEDLEAYLVATRGGTVANPYAALPDKTAVRQAADAFFQAKFADSLGHSKELTEAPSAAVIEEGKLATAESEELTKRLAAEDSTRPFDFTAIKPQWIKVNGGIKGDDSLFYRFCDYTEIDKMLPRVLWETYADTVDSVKQKKGGTGSDHTLTWSVPQHMELKDQGMTSLALAKKSAAPHKEEAVLERAQQHMGNAQTRLSPFVSLSEDENLLATSTDPTMQSIVRSDENLVDVAGGEDMPAHKFHTSEGVERARGYQRAPHIVKFQIPARLIITPEMCDAHRNLSAEEISSGLGLKAMRDAKERLFLGGDVWKYAVEVAKNPY